MAVIIQPRAEYLQKVIIYSHEISQIPYVTRQSIVDEDYNNKILSVYTIIHA